MGKYLYMPIESKTRELDAKIFLALEAAKKGYICIIGTKDLNTYLRYLYLPRGIFLYKDSINIMEAVFKGVQEKGHKVIVHDEEGFVQFSWKDYLETRIKYKTLKYVDIYLCWGVEQYEAIKSVASNINPKLLLLVTGHPRIDLLRQPVCNYNHPGKNSEKVILINMKFAPVNYNNPNLTYVEKQLKDKPFMSSFEKKELLELVAYKDKLLGFYNKLIVKILHEFPERVVVIRPHPIENIDYWRREYDGYNKVVVSNSHPIGYWLHNSGVIVHTGCTTAIEGFLRNVPSIAYHPFTDKKFEIDLPDSLSFRADSEKKCLDKIRLLLSSEFHNENQKKRGYSILNNFISNLQNGLSVESIVNSFDKLQFNSSKNTIFSILNLKVSFKIADTLFKLREKYIKKKTIQAADNSISCLYVEDVVQRFKNATKDTSEYNIKKISNNAIYISKKD